MKDTRMETGRWYTENDGEKAREAAHTIIMTVIAIALYLIIGKLLLIG